MAMNTVQKQLNASIDALKDVSLVMSKIHQEQDDNSPYRLIASQILTLKSAILCSELNVLIGGEIKVGKSSLLNCILGKELLSVAEEVCTNVPTKIKYGEQEKYIVYFNEDENGNCRNPKEISYSEIPIYTSEKMNVRNEKNVQYLEIQTKNDYLKNGLTFIDTPGLGALDPRHAQATMNIASHAHVILFLGSSDKQLTRSEVESLKTLIDLSKCDFITHVLTHSDRNSPDSIMNENKKILSEELPQKQIKYIKVSSKYYRDFLKYKDLDDLKDSGYENLFEYINGINLSAKEVLMEILKRKLYSIAFSLKKMIDHEKSLVEDPSKVEKELENIKEAKEKILNIEKNIKEWDEVLQNEIIDVEAEVQHFLNNKVSDIEKKINEKVQDDYYLNPNNMSVYLNEQMQLLQQELDLIYSSKMQEVYYTIERQMGINKIRKDIMGFDSEEINNVDLDISQNSTIETVTIAKNIAGSALLGGAVFGYLASTKVGSAVGAKIGFWLGSIIPGFGNIAGTTIGVFLGGLTGFVTAIFTSKKAKRNAMFSECKKNMATFINHVRIKLQSVIKKSAIMLRNDVHNYLTELRKASEEKIKTYSNLANAMRSNWTQVGDASTVVDFICEKLQ